MGAGEPPGCASRPTQIGTAEATTGDDELAPAPAGWVETIDALQISEALRESEARLQALLCSLEDVVFELDEDGTYLAVWTNEESLLVRPASDLLGHTVIEAVGEELGQRVIAAIRSVLASRRSSFIDYWLEVPAGRVYFQARIAPIAGASNPGRVCFLSRDVTAQRLAEQARDDAEQRLRHQAQHDGLTGLPNRTQFQERLAQALLRCRQSPSGRLAIVMLDVDRFKEINDTLGHAAGDTVLQHVARRLRTTTREGDLIARLGGDEFAILLPDADDEAAATVAGRVSACLDTSIAVDGVLLNVDVSMGIAFCPRDGEKADALLRRADLAMYAAKRRNSGFALYDKSVPHRTPEQLALLGELRGALDRGEIVLYFQPELALSSGEVRKVEALVRWLHPQRGIVAPDEFIPLVEETGLMQSLTHHILDLALQQCRLWLDAGRTMSVGVNLAMRDLIDISFPEDVADLLRAHRVRPEMLSLEITERSVMADPTRTRKILDRLAEIGVQLSVDDFGTGYSSLTYLTRLPVDEVKIDRSFVTSMASEPDNEVVVRSIIDLAKNLHKRVVAEGVETLDVLRRLQALGCNSAQGFYISRPVPADELDRWLYDNLNQNDGSSS